MIENYKYEIMNVIVVNFRECVSFDDARDNSDGSSCNRNDRSKRCATAALAVPDKIFANSYDFNVKEFSLCLLSLIIFDAFFWFSIKDNEDGLYWYYHKMKNNSEKDYGVKLKLKLYKKYFFRVA